MVTRLMPASDLLLASSLYPISPRSQGVEDAPPQPDAAVLGSLIGSYFPPTPGAEQVSLPPYRLRLLGQDEAR